MIKAVSVMALLFVASSGSALAKSGPTMSDQAGPNVRVLQDPGVSAPDGGATALLLGIAGATLFGARRFARK